ncbi:putative snf5-domain-containing protein [Phaeoacremonium minimum UCRPA7]|uniref:Putative snf5-domain-containing protein n=1 Tax=Phaeoacremonium minimum (strain UCR-PA7) TaxID=1286976 RepID=R8BWV9_PHAM7|nr:putative snf5-domain-containing protein [Phaeoacremonium minimum UCRPA7]EOO03789.1 putative snf5-domain-containing protein [Phaeoacremonium minimum UCRPA7]
MAARSQPQAFTSSYAPRLRVYNNSFLTPNIHSAAPSGPLSRTTKRGTTVINYAEDGYDDYDDDDDDSRRRPTGLRSLRRDDSAAKIDPTDKVGKETSSPVEMQGIFRDWMIKSKNSKSDMQNYAQACLPLTLIPIRIDVDIPAFTPNPPFIPMPNQPGYDPTNPMYKTPETTVPYRLKDTFLWNLHETLITTDQFATTLVQDLDLPNRNTIIAEISKQIRTQLEEYAGVALHPLFHSQHQSSAPEAPKPAANGGRDSSTPIPAAGGSRADTPRNGLPHVPSTPSKLGPGTPVPGSVSAPAPVQVGVPEVTATATLISDDPEEDDTEHNPDDTYRCIINLNVNLSNQLYTDKFEWSLLHPPGTAEAFAKQTCADLGLTGEWIPALTHAIYEAVLRLKKEACEAGGLVAGWAGSGAVGGAEFPNDALMTVGGEGAGWRYDPEQLADEWEPKVEVLSKEEIEKREGDRERQIRRLRRETARFSSNTGMLGGVPLGFGFGGLIEQEEERMGRGERSKKKKRFRSLSPLRSGTPGGRGTPDVGGGGYGGGGTLTEQERLNWRCSHCRVWGSSVWAVRDGPYGARSLCNNCGFMYERDRKLPRWTKNLHYGDLRQV